MTGAAVRQAISDAASAVPGVTVTPYSRQVTRVGEGWVRLDRTDYPNPFGGLVTWQVVVMLPQDVPAAERWLDENGQALRGAVESELAIRSMTPVQLSIPDAGTVPAVVIEGQREEE